jgi:RNA polymerase sigma-70 factor (ECF subfamily)
MSDTALIEAALGGDERAMRRLVDDLAPVIQARVAKVLLRGAGGRGIRPDVEDLTQEIFASLFDDAGKILRAWQPERGLSLRNFVGLVATRQATSIVRSGRTNPWRDDPATPEELHPHLPAQVSPEAQVVSRDLLREVAERFEANATPLAQQMFVVLFVEQRSVEEVSAELGMAVDAVYAWRSRLSKRMRTLIAEVMSDSAAAARKPGDEAP